MKNLLLIFFLLISHLSNSQVLSPSGIFTTAGNMRTGNLQVSWTLGDFQTKTLEESEHVIVTQGFLQGNILITKIITAEDNIDYNVNVFPNPVKDFLNIELSSEKNVSLIYQIYNLDGKIILSDRLEPQNSSVTIDFTQFESGVYLLKAFSSDNTFIKTFKILYQD